MCTYAHRASVHRNVRVHPRVFRVRGEKRTHIENKAWGSTKENQGGMQSYYMSNDVCCDCGYVLKVDAGMEQFLLAVTGCTEQRRRVKEALHFAGITTGRALLDVLEQYDVTTVDTLNKVPIQWNGVHFAVLCNIVRVCRE